MPGTRAVLRGAGEDIQRAVDQGNYGPAVGHLIRGTAALVPSVIEDTVEPWTRAAEPITTGAINAASTAITGDSKPVLRGVPSVPATAAPSTHTPTPAGSGITLPGTGAGAGRGSVIPLQDPSARPANIDNFTGRAASSLRDGQDGMGWANPGSVYKTVDPKTGTVTYSGRDVSGDISGKTVDGTGARVSLRGGVTTGGAGGPGSSGAALHEARMAALTRGETLEGGGGQNLTPDQSPFRGSRLRNAKMQAETQHIQGLNPLTARGQDIALRGQDLNYDATMTGHMMGKQAQVARLRYDMSKDQRDFAAGRADKNFEQRKAREEQLDKQLESRFLDPETGKPNQQKVYEYKQFIQNGLAKTSKDLLASGDPKLQELGRAMAGRSYADLDPQDLQALEQFWQNREASAANAGGLLGQIFLNKGKHVDSLNPHEWAPVGVEERTLGGDHIRFGNGSSVSANDLRGSSLGIFPASTTMHEETIRQGMKAQKLREGY